MSSWQKAVGSLLIGVGLLLGGCAVGGDGGRPVLGLDGQQIDLSDPVERGRAQILTGQYGLAVDGLTQVVSGEPANARALTLLAVAYGQLKRFDLADRYHAAALQIDPNSVAALNNWGYSYLVRGDKARAAGLLERAVGAGNDRPIIAANLAMALDDGRSRPSAAQTSAVPAPQDSVRLSEHVTLVRPSGRLMRMAPGVQMLLTSQPLEAPSQAPSLLLQPSRQAAMSADPLGGGDTRFALFRALFALMEGQPSPQAHGLLQAHGLPELRSLPEIQILPGNQIAAVPVLAPTPFGYFPEVDDFSRQ
jgi:tetratricopeptide (TPR) repeat protein